MARSQKFKRKIISFVAHKGGVAKTTDAVGLGQALAFKGYRVLLVDLEENNNLTSICLSYHPEIANLDKRNLYSAVTGFHSLEEVIWKNSDHGFDVIPTIGKIQQLDFLLYSDISLGIRLSEELFALEYDFIILDVHPSLNNAMRFAIEVSDLLLAPLEEDTHNADGVRKINQEMDIVSKKTGKKIPLLVVRSNISPAKEELLAQVVSGRSLKMTHSVIYTNDGIKTAKNLKQPLNTKSTAFTYFLNLAEELLSL
ncbi:AAA family ATPase [Leptospira sp. 201903071]|uniref:ParA family protein n=1 Tax=Leptospira ainazelensis TaxID=2810034 RepID=UPI0019626CDE|nr:AAA family ATPase [Leptospira ainazelensis]MBM9502919.1 AAA family ATPase [Leptospira ainazelensis]